jgi:hypothetical protein
VSILEIHIKLYVPDGVSVAGVRANISPVPDDFEHEPLPPFQGTEEHFDDYVGGTTSEPPVELATAIVQTASPVRRGIAVAQPAPFAWEEGMKHDPSHKPLKAGRQGLYCPTKVGKGPQGDVWCTWRAA